MVKSSSSAEHLRAVVYTPVHSVSSTFHLPLLYAVTYDLIL
jgi:hypothetical protein